VVLLVAEELPDQRLTLLRDEQSNAALAISGCLIGASPRWEPWAADLAAPSGVPARPVDDFGAGPRRLGHREIAVGLEALAHLGDPLVEVLRRPRGPIAGPAEPIDIVGACSQ